MRWTLAAFAAAISVAITGVMANASSTPVPTKPTPLAAAPAPVAFQEPTGKQAIALHQALAQLRAKNKTFRKMTDSQILAALRRHVQLGGAEGASQAGAGIRPMVSGFGTGTLWFSRGDVAWYATAGTTAVIALLLYVGIVSWEAWPIVGSLIGTFWAAWSAGRCVWLTYRKPRSWGSFAC